MNLSGLFLGDDHTDDCCIFPFTYNNITYNQCTKTGHINQTWCATEVDADGNYNGNWKNCNENCKKGETFIYGLKQNIFMVCLQNFYDLLLS